MMRVSQIFFWKDRAREMQELANRISARCLSAVWQKVSPQSTQMGPAEARGYVRVRAASIVEREIGVAGKHHLLQHEGSRTDILELSLECVVSTTLNRIRTQVVGTPSMRQAA